MSLIILINILPSTSITVKAEEMFITGCIEVFSDIDNTVRKIKALKFEETIFVSAEDISLITGYDLEIGEFINYSKVGGIDTVTAVDIEFDGAVSAMGKKFEIHIVNSEDKIYLPLLQMLYLLHSQWWVSEDKLVIRSLPYTIIDFLGSENYISMWENKVNQTDLLINGENKLAHVLRTSLAVVFNDFDPEIFILWWPDKGVSPILNEEYEEALLQIAIDDVDFLNSCNLETMNSIFEEIGFSDIKSDWDSMKNIIDIPDNIAEVANDIDKLIEQLSKDKAIKSNFIYDFETFDPAILKATSEKMENISNVLDITSIILDVAEIRKRSQNWGEQYINQIRVLTDFDDRGYNKLVANKVKTVAGGLIEEYQDPIQAAAEEAALQSTSLFLSKVFDESVFGKYFAVLTAGISIAKTNDNVKNDMEAADLAYMVDCLVKIEQIAMKEMSRSYSKLLGNNITGDFTQADLERLRNCAMLSLRTNLRNRAFIYYLNLRLNDDSNWENSIYAQNIQQQIIHDYARICLLMETEKSDNLLWIDDFKNMYSNKYGLIREQFTSDIFHEGEIVDIEQKIYDDMNVELIGHWIVDVEKTSDANDISFMTYFGSGIKYGYEMILNEGGVASWYIGIGNGGEGVYSFSNSNGELKYYDYEDGSEKTVLLSFIEEGSVNYIVMEYDNYILYWIRSEEKLTDLGLVSRLNYYSSSNECISYAIPKYDINREIGGIKYSIDGKEIQRYEYEYDEYGNRVKEIWFEPGGNVYYWNEHDYYESGKKLQSRHFSADGKMNYFIEYEYDEYGKCFKEVRYDPYGSKQSYFENEYNEQNQIIKSVLYNVYSGNKTHWIEFEYDSYGNCIEEKWYEINGNFIERTEKIYAYDKTQQNIDFIDR